MATTTSFFAQHYVEYSAGLVLACIAFTLLRFYYCRYRFNDWAARNGCARPSLIPNSVPFNYAHKINILRDKSDALDVILRNKYEQYGKTHGICGYFTGDIKVLSTMEPKNIQTIFTRPEIFPRPKTHIMSVEPFMHKGIFTTHGQAYKNVRNLLRPEFTTQRLRDLEAFDRHVETMFDAMPQVGNDGWTDQFSFLELLHFFTLDTTTELLFGSSVSSQRAAMEERRRKANGIRSTEDLGRLSPTNVAKCFDSANEWVSMRMRLGTAYWYCDGLEFRRSCKTVHDFTDQFVTQALKDAAERRNDTNSTKSSTTSSKGGLIDSFADFTTSPKDLRSQTLHVLIAARDTTAAMISWAINRLLRNPAAMARLRSEILTSFGTESQPLKPLNFATLKECKYLQWVLMETNRMYPAGPINARAATEDTILPVGGGPDGTQPIAIRKGTQVKFCNYLTHRDTDIWGSDAWDFVPERWENRKHGWEYTPFGGGARLCPGQQYGLTEGAFVLVRLFQRFDQIVSMTSAEDMDQKMYKTIVVVKDGLQVKLHRADQ